MSNTKPNKPNLQIQSIHINETLPFSHRQAKPKLSKLYTSLPATLEMPSQQAKRLRRTRTLPNQTPSLASMLIAGGRSVYRRPSRCKSLNVSLNTVHSDVAADCPADWLERGGLSAACAGNCTWNTGTVMVKESSTGSTSTRQAASSSGATCFRSHTAARPSASGFKASLPVETFSVAVERHCHLAVRSVYYI